MGDTSRWTLAPGLLTPRQVSDKYGIAEQTLANWRSSGDGPECWIKVSGEVGRSGGAVAYDDEKTAAYFAGRGIVPRPAVVGTP